MTIRNMLATVIALFMSSGAIGDEWAAGVPVNTPFPNIEAVDQNGVQWTNKELLGQNGLVFFFNRSTSW